MPENPPIGVIGVGWVGLVTAGCFAELGHEVWCRDIDPAKLASLREAKVPIHEPGLQELVARNSERLHFEDELRPVLEHARLLFVCVDTPPTHSGDADLSRVEAVIEELPDSADHAIVMKSTVPCGTGASIRRRLGELDKNSLGYAANPEFLQEGSAVEDFMHPDRVVIGSESPAWAGDAVAKLYEPLDCPIVRTDVSSAEMIKLASNAFLATKISFINEIANVCEELGADVSEVAAGMGLDPRIGESFLRAGIGYGGSCLVGEESLLVRLGGEESTLRTFRQLFDSHDVDAIVGPGGAALVMPHDVEVLAWREGSPGAEFRQVSTVTRRHFSGKGVEVVAQGGRSVRCTPDHPFVVRREGVTALVQAQELRIGDQLPAVFLEESQPGGIDTDEQLLFAKVASETVITPTVSPSLPVNWCRIGGLHRFDLDDDVYSLEVPSAHTFVANGPGGLVVHNCFPKDVSALKQLAGNSGYHFQLLTAVIEVNELQKRRVVNKLKRHLGSLIGKRIALLGLAFKPNTDDMREATSVVLAARLQAEGAIVRAYDPVAEDRARELMTGVEMCDSAMNALEGANAAVIVTEWPEFVNLDLAEVRERMADPVLVDGRNVLSAEAVQAAGLVYEGIGRT